MSEHSAFETNDSANTNSAFETDNVTNSAFETGKEVNSAFETRGATEDDSAFEKPNSAFGTSEIPQCSAGFIVGGSEADFEPDRTSEIQLTDHDGKRYHLVDVKRLSAQGAMGEAYKASLVLSDGATSEKVLLKKCLFDSQNEADKVHLFVNESELTCRKCGPNVIHGICYGNDDAGKPFFIAEFYEGETLEKKIEWQDYVGKYSEAANVVLGILDGLMQLKNHGIVHRDLKPANIIIKKDGTPVIIDLGFACKDTYEDLAGLSKIGTKGYAAPEQMNGGRSSYSSDIYAVGIILLEMLTGSREISSAKKLVVDGIRDFIEKCCQENPDNRFLSAREARAKLEYALKSISKPEKQQELFEIEVAKRFCDDCAISELEADVLREIASRYCLSENVARDIQKRLCQEIRDFREKDLIENILFDRLSNADLDDRADKIHVSGDVVHRWKKMILLFMQKYANALQLSDETACQEILKIYPFFKGYESEIRAKFRSAAPRPRVNPSSTPAQKNNRGKIIGIAVAVLFVALCFALYPKNAEKSSADKTVVSTTSEVKAAETQVQPSVESDVSESNTFVKPENFDDSKEFFDSRDGRVYKLLNYADKVWLVGNLSYAGKALSFAKCYDNSRSCEEFGRLYDYESAQKACPAGFRLPSQEEWERVLKKVGAKGADKLKSYDGFAALNAGYYQKAADAYFYKGELAGWWVGDSQEKETAKVFNMFRNDPMMISKESVGDAYSVRCVKE